MKSMPFLKVQRLLQQSGPEFTRQVQHTYGDLSCTNPPLLPRVYFVFHPDHITEVLVRQAQNVDKPALILAIFRSAFGNGLFTSEGDLWRRQRKLMQPSFHHVRIRHFAEQMIAHTMKVLEGWHDGETRIIDEEMHALTFSIVVDTLFSADASGRADEVMGAMQDLRHGFEAQAASLYYLLTPDWAPFPAMRRKRRGVKTINRVVHEIIAERRTLGEDQSPQDLLSILVFARDEDTGEHMDDVQIHDELMTLFIAGHHTTAVLLGWVWALLSQNPEIETALHREVVSALDGRPLVLDDLARMPMVERVIKESLRLYPPSPGLFREVRVPLQLGDEPIRKGSIMFFGAIATHRDARWFPDPHSFKPDRWTDEMEKELPKGAFFPFGMGPHRCIGSGLAMMEAQLITAAITQRFRLELLDQPETYKGAGALRFAEPVRVRLHAR